MDLSGRDNPGLAERKSGMILAEVELFMRAAHRGLVNAQDLLSKHRNEGTISRVRTSLDVLIKQLQKARTK